MNRILSPNRRHQGTALGKSCPLCAELLLAPLPARSGFFPPSAATFLPFLRGDSWGWGQSTERRGGRARQAPGAPSSTPRNVSPRQSQDRASQALGAPGCASLPASIFMTTLSSPHLSAKRLQLKPSSLPRKLGFCIVGA